MKETKEGTCEENKLPRERLCSIRRDRKKNSEGEAEETVRRTNVFGHRGYHQRSTLVERAHELPQAIRKIPMIGIFLWRRGEDSNLRYLAVCSLSKRVH